MGEHWDAISVFLLSTFKFVLGGVPLAVGFGFSFLKAATITSFGGCVGVMFFVFLSDRLIKNVKKIKEKRQGPQTNSKPVFTRKNKTIITIKKKFGLMGIALLSPVLISIPLGCYLAVRYFKDKNKIIAYMFVSVLAWAVVSIPIFMYFKGLLALVT